MHRGRLAPAIVAGVVGVVIACASCSSSSPSAAPTTVSTTVTTSRASSSTSVPTPAPTSTSAPSRICTGSRAAAPFGQSSQTFQYQGVARTYQLYVPRAYTGTAAVPLVFDFHGTGSNAIQQMVYGNFEPLADRNDFLVVAPDGQGVGSARHYNLTGEKGLQNDITMVLALLDHIEAAFCVDTARVYATGMSDGGGMTSALACLAPNRFAAFGPVAVQFYRTGCAGTFPVAMVAFHGTADAIVPYTGGSAGGAVLGAVPATMAQWAAHDHCDAAFTDVSLGSQVVRRTWTGCVGSSSVVLYTIVGGGHTWPGSIPIARFGLTTSQINATDTIWAFFAAHPLGR